VLNGGDVEQRLCDGSFAAATMRSALRLVRFFFLPRETAVARPWEADPETTFLRRIGKSPQELGVTSDSPDCPDMWELENGDVAVIGRDLSKCSVRSCPPECRLVSMSGSS
jgi:hypothetical protein